MTAAFLDALRAALPGLRLTVDPVDLDAARRDETPALDSPFPIAVAFPTATQEVAGIVRFAAEHRVPIVPRGGGTGLAGGAAAVEGSLVVAFARMNRILEIDEENQVAVVQPGVVNKSLNDALAGRGLVYAPDPASYETCTIGGNLGTNAGGLCCVKYGVTRDAVLGLEVVLADGSVIRTGGRNVKDVAGYDLTGLFVGSMGTLGLITEATLRLVPTPAPKQTLLAFFPTIEAARRAIRIGVFGHAGDGNLHPSFILDPADPAVMARFESAHDDVLRAALDLGGSVTGEHGIGLAKKAWLEPTRGPDAVRAMRAIKVALDPHGILNPGKVL